MKLELYYVVRKYRHSSGEELAKPLYVAGPFDSLSESIDYISDRFRYNRESYVMAKQIIDVEEI